MKLNPYLFLSVLLQEKEYLSTLSNSSSFSFTQKDFVDHLKRFISCVEAACSVSPADYLSLYFCTSCGWVGDEPDLVSRDDFYLSDPDIEVIDGKIRQCPVCKGFLVYRRESSL